MVIGVLALQGDYAAHRQALHQRGAAAREVRTAADLAELSGIVLPGGESTTMMSFLRGSPLAEELVRRIRAGTPVLATCAGVILLAREVRNPPQDSLALLDVVVERNAYGRQRESFEAPGTASLDGRPVPVEMVFIRAPRIRRVGPGVEVLATHGGEPVMARQGTVLAATFHPELTDGVEVHRFFCEMVRRAA